MAVSDIIRAAALQYGLDPNQALRMAQIESSGNPNATTTGSSAKGLFQFTNGTWAQYGHGNVFDPVANTDAAMRLARDNAAHFRQTLGRDPNAGELYLMHQQGAGGATKLLQNPNALATDVVGQQAVLNNGGHPGMTAGQFANLWTSKFGGGAPVTLAEPQTPVSPAGPPENTPPSPTAAPGAAQTSPMADALSQLAKRLSPPRNPGIRQTAGGMVIDT